MMNKIINAFEMLGFLSELNSIINKDSLYVNLLDDDRTDDRCMRFQIHINSIYVAGANWTASDEFVRLVEKLAKKHFDASEVNFNNTRCIFWIYNEEIPHMDTEH